jgi:hypothetical protein
MMIRRARLYLTHSKERKEKEEGIKEKFVYMCVCVCVCVCVYERERERRERERERKRERRERKGGKEGNVTHLYFLLPRNYQLLPGNSDHPQYLYHPLFGLLSLLLLKKTDGSLSPFPISSTV